MAFTTSSIFRAFLADVLENTAPFDLSQSAADIPKAALYDNSITPDNDVTSANSAYGGAGVWSATGGQTGTPQVYHTGQWAVGGVALGTIAFHGADTADVVWYDSADPQSGTSATMSNIYGVYLYDDTLTTPVVDQGICFNAFSGAQQVSNGQFTVVVHANGWARWTQSAA